MKGGRGRASPEGFTDRRKTTQREKTKIRGEGWLKPE